MSVASRPRVLSLCAGYGGLDVGVGIACRDAVTVCYVERDVQAAAVLVKNMREGGLDDAPVWSDMLTFDAAAWRGCVDLVVAGFPCQPVSVAGKRAGREDSRWLWPEVARIVADSGASACFLENVPGLVSAGLQDVLLDIHAMGFNAEWGLYSAAEAGAPHKRDRWFCLAYAGRVRPDWLQQVAEQGGREQAAFGGNRAPVANADQRTAWPPGPEELDHWVDYLRVRSGSEPSVCGGAHGTAGRLDRLRILGNGAVPQQVAIAFADLASRVTP